MGEEAQRETIAFLRDVCARAGDASAPMSTHISHVYFAGDTVYKLKRAVRTSYLDFSTSEKRLAACETGTRFSTAARRRNSIAPCGGSRASRMVSRSTDQANASTPWWRCAVSTRTIFSTTMAQRGALTARHVEALARKIAAFHEAAAPSTAQGGARGVRRCSRHERGRPAKLVPRARAGRFARVRGDARAACAQRFAPRRAAAGGQGAPLPRRSHPAQHRDDRWRTHALRLPRIRRGARHDRCALRSRVRPDGPVAQVARRSRERAAQPLSRCRRTRATGWRFCRCSSPCARSSARTSPPACRRMRRAPASKSLKSEARDYVALAREAMAEGAPVLVGVGGLSGSGKSTVASALAPMLAPIPGARVLSSDRIRKALFGAAPTDRLPQDAYAPHVSERVYAHAREKAGRCLDARLAGHLRCRVRPRADRDALAQVAAQHDAPFLGVWLEASSRHARGARRRAHGRSIRRHCRCSARAAGETRGQRRAHGLDAARRVPRAAGNRRAHQGRAENLSAIAPRARARAAGLSDRRPSRRRTPRAHGRAGPHAMESPQGGGDNRDACNNPSAACRRGTRAARRWAARPSSPPRCRG